MRFCLILFGCFCLILFISCQKNDTKPLKIGIIKPSIDHLPLDYALQKNYLNPKLVEIINFMSGWETQEALANNKIDMAIMPFTYAWSLASKGYKVKIVSCLERETDGILVNQKIKRVKDLNKTKVGVLRASTLEILLHDFSLKNQIEPHKVFFRTPNEMVAALTNGEVDAIVIYVPIIQKLSGSFRILHWFSTDHPSHPCCDLVCNISALKQKEKEIDAVKTALEKSVAEINQNPEQVISLIQERFQLNAFQARAALSNTVFAMGVNSEDREFERTMMMYFKELGYQEKLPEEDDIFY